MSTTDLRVEETLPQGKCQRCGPVLRSLSVHLKPPAPTFSTKSESMLWKPHLSEPLYQGRMSTHFSFIQSHTKACVSTYWFLPLHLSRTVSCLQNGKKGRGDCFSYLKKKKKKKKVQPCNSGRSYISDRIRALGEKRFRPTHFFPRQGTRGSLIMHLKSFFVTLWLIKILLSDPEC